MKNVFLLGDSIRFGAPPASPGYGVYVREKLTGRANVYWPEMNCEFAQFTLRFLRDWARDVDRESIDVIHWNNGLWDIHRLDGDDPLTPCDVYADMLRRIYKKMTCLFPNAKVIFALTTHVIEEDIDPDFAMYNQDIEQYNQAAAAMMRSLGVTVNDLYTLTEDFGWDMHSDYVHFNESGCRRLADAVVEAVMK